MSGDGWWPVLAACVLAYATKLAGHLLPERWLDHPVAARCAQLLPVALLAALVATSTLVGNGVDGRHLVIDARLAALAVAVLALLVRAPFIVVVVLAAVTAAGLRALGWG